MEEFFVWGGVRDVGEGSEGVLGGVVVAIGLGL